MTATLDARAAARAAPVFGWAVPVAIALGLSAIVGGRALAVRSGFDALLVGAAFGAALLALAVTAHERVERGSGSTRLRPAWARPSRLGPIAPSAAIGVLVGLVLVAVAVAGPAIGGVIAVPGIGRPAAPFAPWALITLVVVAGEEGVLRGALFDRIERVGGVAAAIALTTLAFALMHVPLYGWHVVPLDLAVGLVLAGLRLWTGALVAPIAAHAVADLATWWL